MGFLPVRQDLTPDQQRVIELPLDVSHLVTGPPGSGKTVMALYRAHALARVGEPVMLLMFSKLLSRYAEGALGGLSVEETAVSTYHSWFPKWFKAAYSQQPPMISRYEFDWAACIGIVGNHPAPEKLRPHVLVDEGQDMPQEFYLFLRLICRSMTVFADENQILMDHNSTNEEIRIAGNITSTARLERNFRNTRAIARVSSHFWTGAGDPPVELRDSAEDGDFPVLDRDPALNDTIQRIVTFERANSTQQIGVLLPYTKLVKRFLNRLRGKTVNPVQYYLSKDGSRAPESFPDFGKPGIKILTWASTKGLEFDTVFLPELQAYKASNPSDERFRMQMYVLASRARRELFFIYSGTGEPTILSTLPMDDIDDWR